MSEPGCSQRNPFNNNTMKHDVQSKYTNAKTTFNHEQNKHGYKEQLARTVFISYSQNRTQQHNPTLNVKLNSVTHQKLIKSKEFMKELLRIFYQKTNSSIQRIEFTKSLYGK